jgi:transposase
MACFVDNKNSTKMANRSITMLQSKRILQLLAKGKSKRGISQELNISLNTVKKYEKRFKKTGKSYQELLNCDTEQYLLMVYPNRNTDTPTVRLQELQELLPEYAKALRTSHKTRQMIWLEYHQTHPGGYSYSHFCEHLSVYLLKEKVVMHLEHKPGDVLQIDFAGEKLSYTDTVSGKTIVCPVLVCTMPFSSFCYIEALPNMTQLELIGGLNRCLEYLGGVPANICSDNLKQVVTKSDRYEPVFSELMEQFAFYYNTSLMATRIVKPRDKASVERHVGISYHAVYAPVEQEKHTSLPHLNQALMKHLDAMNDKPMQGKTYSRRQQFLQFEKPVLRALPDEPFEVKHKTSAKVQTNYHVTLGKDWHNYSVPYQYVGKRVEIIYDSKEVEIYFNMNLIASHRRNLTRNGFTTQIQHCPEKHKQAIINQQITPEVLVEKARSIGVNTQKYVQGILNQDFFSQQNHRSCMGIFQLSKHYGNDRVEKACEMALNGMRMNYRTIKNILANNMDKTDTKSIIEPVTVTEHINIRGNNFFIQFFNH